MATTSSSVSTTVASLVQGLDVSSQVSSMILQQEQCNRNRELNLRIKALLGFLLRVKKMWGKRKRLVRIEEGNYDLVEGILEMLLDFEKNDDQEYATLGHI